MDGHHHLKPIQMEAKATKVKKEKVERAEKMVGLLRQKITQMVEKEEKVAKVDGHLQMAGLRLPKVTQMEVKEEKMEKEVKVVGHLQMVGLLLPKDHLKDPKAQHPCPQHLLM